MERSEKNLASRIILSGPITLKEMEDLWRDEESISSEEEGYGQQLHESEKLEETEYGSLYATQQAPLFSSSVAYYSYFYRNTCPKSTPTKKYIKDLPINAWDINQEGF